MRFTHLFAALLAVTGVGLAAPVLAEKTAAVQAAPVQRAAYGDGAVADQYRSRNGNRGYRGGYGYGGGYRFRGNRGYRGYSSYRRNYYHPRYYAYRPYRWRGRPMCRTTWRWGRAHRVCYRRW